MSKTRRNRKSNRLSSSRTQGEHSSQLALVTGSRADSCSSSFRAEEIKIQQLESSDEKNLMRQAQQEQAEAKRAFLKTQKAAAAEAERVRRQQAIAEQEASKAREKALEISKKKAEAARSELADKVSTGKLSVKQRSDRLSEINTKQKVCCAVKVALL